MVYLAFFAVTDTLKCDWIDFGKSGINMAKFSKQERESLIEEARSLYVAGFLFETIAAFISNPGKEVSVVTLKKWAESEGFERSKTAKAIQRQEILSVIAGSFQQLKNGEEPKISALAAAQYASAIEKLSDRNKLLMYSMEAFDALTDHILKDIEATPKKKDKDQLFAFAKKVRSYCDKVVEQLNEDTLG